MGEYENNEKGRPFPIHPRLFKIDYDIAKSSLYFILNSILVVIYARSLFIFHKKAV
jgi:hypothetical protein